MKYTVMLQRPDYIADPYGVDTYTAFVDEASVAAAVHAARVEVIEADFGSDAEFEENGHDGLDYAVLAIFKGHIMAEPYPYYGG
jgi:hypothetical protein